MAYVTRTYFHRVGEVEYISILTRKMYLYCFIPGGCEKITIGGCDVR